MIPIGTPIAIAAASREQVDEAFMRLARVGEESVVGFILIDQYTGEKKTTEQVSVDDVHALIRAGLNPQIVDVRRPAEYANGHIAGVVNIPLDTLPRDFEKLDPSVPIYVLCRSGYRSSLGTSILENAGFDKIYNITGGTTAWTEAGLETEVSASVCTAQGR
jgi:rhodanese-related sulfurtransferase